MSLPPDLPPLLPFLLRLTCVLHLAIALVYALLQQRYAVRYACFLTDVADLEHDGTFLPSVDVVVPCYNEDPELLDACLTSLIQQDYQGRLMVFVVDDGSVNRDLPHDHPTSLRPVLERHGRRPNWRVIRLPRNAGKRHAVDAGLRASTGEVVVTVDSDTVLYPDAITQVVKPLADPRVGAVAGNIRALNASANLLTRLINQSYWLLFEQERTAQSYFRATLCCYGGCSAYRRSALRKVWQRHLTQTVRGRRCMTGDDLHLTLELLANGYDTVIQPRAKALTNVPHELRRFFRQQLRWSRSFIRELPWAVRAIAGRPAYLAFDLAVQVATPVLKAAVVLLFLVEGAALGPTLRDAGALDAEFLLVESCLMLAALLSTSSLGALQARHLTYVLFGPLYIGVILPGWLRALVSPGHDTWRTRDLAPASGQEDEPRQQCGS